MLKATLTVLAAATILAPAALAESGKPVTLSLEYDTALLTSDASVAELLGDVKRAATRTCTSRIPAFGAYYIDKDCAASLYLAAVKQIHESGRDAGIDVAPAIEQAALTQLASAD